MRIGVLSIPAFEGAPLPSRRAHCQLLAVRSVWQASPKFFLDASEVGHRVQHPPCEAKHVLGAEE
jgi:hypothetical protein